MAFNKKTPNQLRSLTAGLVYGLGVLTMTGCGTGKEKPSEEVGKEQLAERTREAVKEMPADGGGGDNINCLPTLSINNPCPGEPVDAGFPEEPEAKEGVPEPDNKPEPTPDAGSPDKAQGSEESATEKCPEKIPAPELSKLIPDLSKTGGEMASSGVREQFAYQINFTHKNIQFCKGNVTLLNPFPKADNDPGKVTDVTLNADGTGYFIYHPPRGAGKEIQLRMACAGKDGSTIMTDSENYFLQ